MSEEKDMKAKKIALYGMCIALAFLFSYIESLIPVNGLVPGMKLGLTNVVVVFALYYMEEKGAFIINMVRILLVAATFGNAVSLWYSLAGGVLSYLVMVLLKHSKGVHLITVSVAGSVAHNAGQILVAAILLHTSAVGWYFGVLCISGIVAGVAIGILTALVMNRLPKNLLRWTDGN